METEDFPVDFLVVIKPLQYGWKTTDDVVVEYVAGQGGPCMWHIYQIVWLQDNQTNLVPLHAVIGATLQNIK